eukprot:2394052-Amphidinium_carterae.1
MWVRQKTSTCLCGGTGHAFLQRRGTAAWADHVAGPLHGKAVLGASPALLWTHGLSGCVASDEVRGVANILQSIASGRSVMRVDLVGHGKSMAKSTASPAD